MLGPLCQEPDAVVKPNVSGIRPGFSVDATVIVDTDHVPGEMVAGENENVTSFGTPMT